MEWDINIIKWAMAMTAAAAAGRRRAINRERAPSSSWDEERRRRSAAWRRRARWRRPSRSGRRCCRGRATLAAGVRRRPVSGGSADGALGGAATGESEQSSGGVFWQAGICMRPGPSERPVSTRYLPVLCGAQRYATVGRRHTHIQRGRAGASTHLPRGEILNEENRLSALRNLGYTRPGGATRLGA